MATRKKPAVTKTPVKRTAPPAKAAPAKAASASRGRDKPAPKAKAWTPQNPEKPARIITPVARCSFVKVFKADEDGKFSVVLMFPKDTTDMKDLEGAINHVIDEAYKGKRAGLHLPIRDGDDENDAYYEYDDFEGMWAVTAKTTFQPGIVDRNLQDIIDPAEFYSGVWARASVTAFAYEYKGKKGVSFSLNNLQKIRDDENIGGGQSASKEFAGAEELPDDEQVSEEELPDGIYEDEDGNLVDTDGNYVDEYGNLLEEDPDPEEDLDPEEDPDPEEEEVPTPSRRRRR